MQAHAKRPAARGDRPVVQGSRSLDAQALREVRIARNETQRRFWARFGVTQSRGSRFELGSTVPSPVAILLRLYLGGVISDQDLWRVRARSRAARDAAALRD